MPTYAHLISHIENQSGNTSVSPLKLPASFLRYHTKRRNASAFFIGIGKPSFERSKFIRNLCSITLTLLMSYQFLFADSTKRRVAFLQPDLRRNAARCTCFITDSGANFKGLFVTGSCASLAQGRQSQWAWTGNRSCRFPRRCGGPRQRRSPSWQEWGCPPRQGFPVRGCGGWRCSRP